MTNTYAQHRPTPFDSPGAFLPERQDWILAPVSRNRDSDTLSESNFAMCLMQLGGESDTVEVPRFGHWACGWYEIILVAPERADDVRAIEARLADHPVLNEDDLSEREITRAMEWWTTCGLSERIRICAKYHQSIFAARREEIPAGVDITYLAG